MKASLGRIVIVKTAQAFNCSHVHPAIVNRAWGDIDPAAVHGSHACVNVTVLPDSAPPFSQTSVPLFQTQAEAESSSFGCYAWWPEG